MTSRRGSCAKASVCPTAGICQYRAKTNSQREAVEITTFHVIVTLLRIGATISRCRAYSQVLAYAPVRPHCIWSSMVDIALFTLSAFFTSSAVTYGYSPYSRKLGLW